MAKASRQPHPSCAPAWGGPNPLDAKQTGRLGRGPGSPTRLGPSAVSSRTKAERCGAHAPVFEKTAPQVTLDLAPHKLRQAARLIAALDEARPGALHHLVQRRFLRPSALVAVRALRCRMHMRAQPRPLDLVRDLVWFGRSSCMHRHCRASCTARAKPDAPLPPVFLLLTSRRETHVGRPRSAVATWRTPAVFGRFAAIAVLR